MGPHERRRKREDQALKPWIARLREIEVECRAELEHRPDPDPGKLATEVATLADPHRFDDLDVVVPGGDDELARGWMRARLAGRGASDADFHALAAELAPLPDRGLVLRNDEDGSLYWTSPPEEQTDISEAANSRYGRKRK